MTNEIFAEDFLSGYVKIPEKSINLVFADLPYGVTKNKWDKKIDLTKMWQAMGVICRTDCVFVFTSTQPFTTELISSNVNNFRFSMVWRKNKPRGYLNAKKQPLRSHEDISVFYKNVPKYKPQMTSGHRPVNAFYTRRSGNNYGESGYVSGGGSTLRYPTSVLDIPVLNESSPFRTNSTQKPVELPLWFILSYTEHGNTILDPTCGSGSSLVAAKKCGRNFFGFDIDPEQAKLAKAWVDSCEVSPCL